MSELSPGPRDQLITGSVKDDLEVLDERRVEREPLDDAEAPDRLARYVMDELRRELANGRTAPEQAAQINGLLRHLELSEPGTEVIVPPHVLIGIKGRSPLGDAGSARRRPATPFSQSDLLVNAEGQPNIGSELRAELASADSVDLICAFVIWSGVRHLRDALASVDRPRRARPRHHDDVHGRDREARRRRARSSLGADVRVAFDARTTKLHAKAWLLERASGLTTAFVGSSNLSHTALFDGLEWNVRLSSVDAAHVIDRVRMTFESHWASEHFEPYDPAVNGDELERALREHDRRSLGEALDHLFRQPRRPSVPTPAADARALTVERERHDRHRNLVVAATGTGKTVVAALDYRAAASSGRPRPVAAVRRSSRGDPAAVAGDLSRGPARRRRSARSTAAAGSPQDGTSSRWSSRLHEDALEQIAPDAFDVVVVDEFHHAAATTYDRLLEPPAARGAARADRNAGAARWPGRHRVVRPSHRRRAPALGGIDQGFLVPFQYFGVADGTDLRQLTWRRGGYATEELSNLLSQRRPPCRQAPRGDSEDRARPRHRCARSASACRRSTRATWRASSPTPASPASR